MALRQGIPDAFSANGAASDWQIHPGLKDFLFAIFALFLVENQNLTAKSA
jgi:hypothetical protein